jgi:hypothetical protein
MFLYPLLLLIYLKTCFPPLEINDSQFSLNFGAQFGRFFVCVFRGAHGLRFEFRMLLSFYLFGFVTCSSSSSMK